MKKRYILQNTASKWATFTFIDKLTYAICKNIAEYHSKYFTLKTSIKKQNITIEDTLKIWMLNNFGLAFKTYLTVVNDWMQKDEKLEEDEILFKAIEEKKTHIKTKYKAFVNFTMTKSNAKPQERAAKGEKEFVEWPKDKKCGCKHLANQVCKYADKKCDKYYKKRYITRFHDSYTFLNKGKTPEEPAISSPNTKKNVSCITQVVANKIFEIGITQKIIPDLGTTQHLIANRKLIFDDYDDHLEY